MSKRTDLLAPGQLYPALLARTRRALSLGALQRIDTDQRIITDAGVDFLVRSVSSLQRKRDDKQRIERREGESGVAFNPFLPPEPELTVGGIDETHIGVLNKFNVLDHHLLIVTRDFEPQEMLLTRGDLQALWRVLQEIDGLGFYNGGAEAGASQRHKHLQLVPLPLTPELPAVPISPLFPSGGAATDIGSIASLPFKHAFCCLPAGVWEEPFSAAELTFQLYQKMLAHCGIESMQQEGRLLQSAPYNLLLHRRWMLLIARSGEHWEGVSVNALGYAGSLFVRNQDELKRVLETGPMQLLRAVSLPTPPSD